MKAFWLGTKASLLKSFAPEGQMGQMEIKCIGKIILCGPRFLR
jgi:hypothetical protein